MDQGKRRRRSASQLQEAILAAAAAEFGSRGYRRATTAAIARRAGVTEAQLFRLFGSKAELFQKAVFEPLERRLAAFNEAHLKPVEGGEFAAAARRYVAALIAFLRENRALFAPLIAAEAEEGVPGVAGSESLKDYFDRNAALVAERLGAHGPERAELLVRISFAAVLANVLFADWLFPARLGGQAQLDEAIAAFVLEGISPLQ
ncbi:MAG: hypothetical protein KatS3mg124_0253 [Porticoccaceae bacterium]|nr:MAG: hypothetical protein KatS3mg124_0253 [Porticoccaceae bacterium]